MNASSQPVSPLEQELVDLLDEESKRLGSSAVDLASRVGLTRAWLQELEQEAASLKALVKPTSEQRQRLRHLLGDISYCEEIISKYRDLQRASVPCIVGNATVLVVSASATDEAASSSTVFAASSPTALAAALEPPDGLTKAERTEWFKKNLPAPAPKTKTGQKNKDAGARASCDTVPSSIDEVALPPSTSSSSRGPPTSRFCLNVTNDARISDRGSLLCAVYVEKGQLCRHAIIRNRDGATAVVKSMVDATNHNIENADEGTHASVSLGPVVDRSNGRKVDDSVTLDLSMLKRDTELRSFIALSDDSEQEHLMWYKVVSKQMLLSIHTVSCMHRQRCCCHALESWPFPSHRPRCVKFTTTLCQAAPLLASMSPK
jgi:hypothetical protein